MRALKALVVIMGILLVAGSAVVAGTILSRLSGQPHRAPAIAALPARVGVTLPPGGRLDSVSALGERLALHVTGPAGDAILIVDPATGATLETLDLQPAAP